MNKVIDHGHCEICGGVVSTGTRVCGPECQEKFDEALRYKKRQVWILIGVIAAVLILSNLGRRFPIFG